MKKKNFFCLLTLLTYSAFKLFTVLSSRLQGLLCGPNLSCYPRTQGLYQQTRNFPLKTGFAPLWQNLCIFRTVVLEKYFPHISHFSVCKAFVLCEKTCDSFGKLVWETIFHKTNNFPFKNVFAPLHNVHFVDFDSPVSKIAPVSATGLYNVALEI